MSNIGEINNKSEKNIKKSEIINKKNIAELLANLVVNFGDELGISDFKLSSVALIISVKEKIDKIGNLIDDGKISKEEFEEIKEPLSLLNEELAKFLVLNNKI